MSDLFIPPPLPEIQAYVQDTQGGFQLSEPEYNRQWFERLTKRTILNEKGCFVWTGPLSSKGYIMFRHRGYSGLTHRVVYNQEASRK